MVEKKTKEQIEYVNLSMMNIGKNLEKMAEAMKEHQEVINKLIKTVEDTNTKLSGVSWQLKMIAEKNQ